MPIFDPTIPQPGDFVSDSQQDLLDNNLALDTTFGINHVPFSTSAENGKHKQVDMLNVSGTPAATDKTGTIWTRRSSGRSDLNYTNDNSGNRYQITNVTNNTDYAKLGAATNGWTFMGQRIIMQYGSLVSPASFTVTFPVEFAAIPYSIQVTFAGNSGSNRVYVDSSFPVTTTQFRIEVTNGSGLVSQLWWVAVGLY